MKFLSRLFGNRREINLTTALERQRLGRTMPGQTGASPVLASASSSSKIDSLAQAASAASLQDARLQLEPPPGLTPAAVFFCARSTTCPFATHVANLVDWRRASIPLTMQGFLMSLC